MNIKVWLWNSGFPITFIFTGRQQSCGKVIFSVVSVHHSVHNVTITRDALDLTVLRPFPC